MVKLSAPVAVFGMIFFGTACSLLAKLIYSVRAVNIHGQLAPYEKPWFQVLVMFLGMSICILLDRPRKRPATDSEKVPLLHSQNQSQVTPRQNIWIIGIPTILDLFATACGTTGLLYTNVSVYQMLRGAMLVWTAILSIIFLRRRLTLLNYGGIALCVLGIALVGIANILSERNPSSRSDTVFGILIILLGQVLQAGQVVIEEFLLQDLQMSSVRVVAWEGLFGVMQCLFFVFPIIYFLPGRDGGHMEDVVDAFYMVTHSWAVAGVLLADMTMMLFYNIFGMEVTDSLSAVHRVVIETLRTLCVWIADLFIYYLLSGGKLGEAWTKYSFLQLVGFCLLVAGTMMYNYENLIADYERRKKAKMSMESKLMADIVVDEPATDVTHTTEYDAMDVKSQEPVKDRIYAVAVDEDDVDIDEEEEQVGSYYGHTVGSVAHSPFLVAASGTPSSYSGSLRRRQGLHREEV